MVEVIPRTAGDDASSRAAQTRGSTWIDDGESTA
jgi:hypothetical protein